KVRQGGRRVAATELAGTAEHALGAGSLGHGAYEVFVLVAHYSAGEEGKLILLILRIGVHYVLAAGRGNKGVIRNDNTHVRVVGQHARNDGAVVAGDVHLSGAVSQICHALGYHLAVDGVFDALSLGDDLAHEVYVLTSLIFEPGLQNLRLALAAALSVIAYSAAQEGNVPVAVGIHMLLDPRFGNGG